MLTLITSYSNTDFYVAPSEDTLEWLGNVVAERTCGTMTVEEDVVTVIVDDESDEAVAENLYRAFSQAEMNGGEF